MGHCEAPGCERELEAGATPGRPRRYCSDMCRARAFRRRRSELVAIEVVDLALSLPETDLRRALAAVEPSALLVVQTALLDAAQAL